MTPNQRILNVSDPAALQSAPPTPKRHDHAVRPASGGSKHHHHALLAQLLEGLVAAVATDGHAARADAFSADLQVLPTAILVDNAAVFVWSGQADGSARRRSHRGSASARPDQLRSDQSDASQSEELQ